jgi:dCTP deaminase
MQLTANQIKDLNIVTPFTEKVRGDDLLSHGADGAGYTLRLADECRVYDNKHGVIIGPKCMNLEKFTRPLKNINGCFYLPPGASCLVKSMETLTMPLDCGGIIHLKSSYTRCFLKGQFAKIEPGWCGVLTLQLHNPLPVSMRLHVGEGLVQVTFLTCDETSEYEGRYQSAGGIMTANVRATYITQEGQ